MPFLKSVGSAAKLFPLVTSILTPFQPTEDFAAIGEEIVSHLLHSCNLISASYLMHVTF